MNTWKLSTILLIIVVAALSLFLFQSRGSVFINPLAPKGPVKPIDVPPVVQPPSITPTTGSKDPNLQTFMNEAIPSAKYSITIPIGQKSGWRLNQTVSLDPYYTKDKNIGDKVEIQKDSKTITIFRPEASGPAVCIFNDSLPFEGPSQKFNKFEVINLGSRPARRGKIESNVPAGQDKYTICQKDDKSGLYGTWTEFGYISYDAPTGADVLDMDSIVKTLSRI